MMYIKQNKLNIIVAIVMFIALFAFFAYAHPLIIFDSDDWYHFTRVRYPWPEWKSWNPIRVLPGTIMPLAGYVAAYFVNPFTGDYINSVTYVSAFLTSISITITVFLLGVCTVKTLDMPAEKAYIFAIISCLWGFCIFGSDINSSEYLFRAPNLTCYYYYMLPALLNLSLVFYLMTKEDFPNIYKEMSGGGKGIFILICYLALCSNLFHNVILATYSGLQILYEFFRCKGSGFRKRIVENVKRCYVYYAILVFWLALLPFEAFGGRANSIRISANIWELLFRSFKNLQNIDLHILFLVYVGLLMIGIGIICYKNRSISFLKAPVAKKVFTDSLLCVVLIAIYFIILGARLNGNYINWPSVQISFWMFVLAILSLVLGCIIKELKSVQILLPLFIFFMLMNALDGRYRFKEATTGNVNPITCKSLDYYIIEQFQAADKSGQKEMVLRVPKYKTKNNWPLSVSHGYAIRDTLYLHGLINRNDIKVKVQPVSNKQ